MEDRTAFRKAWSPQQIRGSIGITTLALWSLITTSELPASWAISLGISQVIGLLVTGISALRCFYTSHSTTSLLYGSGVLCTQCKRPSLAGSHHCEICEVCVAACSHHSEWLNNCIGVGNAGAYIGVVSGLGVLAGCQTGADVGLWVLMLSNKEFALYIGEKYSMRDQGYLYHLLQLFSLLVSVSVLIASVFNLILHICWRISQRKHRNKSRFQVISTAPRIDSNTPVLRSDGESAFFSPWKSGEDSFQIVHVTFRETKRGIPSNSLFQGRMCINPME